MKVNPSPLISQPTSFVSSWLGIYQYLLSLVQSVISEFRQHAIVLNAAVTVEGDNGMTAPLRLQSYTVTSVPAAADWATGVIYVSNETGGAILAFSDGTNWRRVTDRTVIS